MLKGQGIMRQQAHQQRPVPTLAPSPSPSPNLSPRLSSSPSPDPDPSPDPPQAHQQRDIHAKREQSSYERKEAEWHESDITTSKGGGDQLGGIDNWMAKQGNN